ncbi:MAG: nitrogenase iron-molybdenum cofactor biosynthesis protein NifN [Gloeomargarita sp. SKYG116]|nr:nitrogenase iron-molybdenum cofactor biosynthesis protein NifN [Gloeomargarita sp. SKYG116]MDW8400813.1 nitrogenase iron-molybdenum cofactor biosynthesis protein NifN [Gloeomargarita sp. SKYGB_i_bin116]
MARIQVPERAVAINPLKLSPPLGAALAFLGIKGALPLLHGSQGCTAFAKVMLVRHFREAIPLATTALTEVSTILGGEDNIRQSLETLLAKAQPQLIGLCSTALAETRGEDIAGILRQLHLPIPVIYACAPDFGGSLSDGYSQAVEAIIRELPQPGPLLADQVTVLAGPDLTPGEVADVKALIQAFGLTPIVIPDLSTSLDGHWANGYHSVTTGGTSLAELRAAGRSAHVLVIGQSLRRAAEQWRERFQVPYTLVPGVTGLAASDDLVRCLMAWSGQSVPALYRQQRRQLLDAMLDTHFYLGGKRVALALEPNQLFVMGHFLASMGMEIQAAVSPTRADWLANLPCETVIVGDLSDLQQHAPGADVLISNCRAAPIAQALGLPLLRMGLPIWDRLGYHLRSYVGYRGTAQLLFDLSNLLLETPHHP